MRRLCYGGSFNPVHHGHLICSRAVAEAAGFDRVVLIPSGQPPHKLGVSDLAPAADRLAMCRRAVAGDPLFEVCDVEVGRSGPSYTVDTARRLATAWGGRVSWLIGADQVRSLPQWHEAAALLAEVDFVLMARPGWAFDWDGLPVDYRQLRGKLVTAPLLELSSTDVRRRAAAGRSVEYLVPPAVAAYLAERRLYAATG